MDIQNYFANRSAAERYAKGRPYFHPEVMQRIRKRIPRAWPVERAIDVACGTGLSTVALMPLAQEIVATDAAAEMIGQALVDPRITFIVAAAEALPVPDDAFDLLTVCSALHWLDAPTFFREAWRVLHRGGHMVIYDNSFSGEMEGNPAFGTWVRDSYLNTYPSPPRARIRMPEAAAEMGFRSLGEERYENGVSFSPETLAEYLITQSNVIAAVEGGRQSIDEVRAWCIEGVRPFFGGEVERTFTFVGPIWYFVKP